MPTAHFRLRTIRGEPLGGLSQPRPLYARWRWLRLLVDVHRRTADFVFLPPHDERVLPEIHGRQRERVTLHSDVDVRNVQSSDRVAGRIDGAGGFGLDFSGA